MAQSRVLATSARRLQPAVLPHNRGRGECHRLDAGQAVCTGANVPRAADFTHRWSPGGRAPFLFFVARRVLGRVRLFSRAAKLAAAATRPF